jgi:hypothetical protein
LGSKGSNTSTSSSAPNPQAMQVYQQLLQQAQGVAATPYNAYGGQLVAPVNQQQGAGIANINQYSGAAQPAIQTAEGMAQQAASPITQAQIQGYMSPYTQDVVNATQAQFNNQNQQQQQGVLGNAISQGALGGNRTAVAQSELANQQQLAQAPVIANLQNQGYQTGLSTALSQQQAQAAGAYSLGNLGVAGQNAGLTGANAQIGAGTLQQGTQQAQDSAAYQQFLNQQAYPFQTTQWLAGLGTGVGSQMGGTSQTTQPAPSLIGQLLGGVSSGAGILGASGAFGASGWLARGGGVGRATGGGVANHETTVPETPHTLMAQQHQLLQGHRRAQLFPHGTSELPLPHGMARATTEAGVIHYNPQHINAETVHHLASGGRLNELLDLGPVTKDEAMRRIHEGEHPVAVVERNEAGHEVRAALGTHLTALDQMHAMHQTKSPGHTLTLEHPDHVVARRIHHHMNAGVANRDTGGGVNYQTFGGGYGTPVTPYSGGHSFVPSMGITHGQGHGAPPPPNSPGQPQADLNSQMKNIGSLAGAIHSGMNQPTALGDNGMGSTNDPSWTGGDPLAGGAAIGTSGIGAAKRGGGISNYADGGTPNFDDRFTGVDPGALPPTIDGVPTQLLLGKGSFDNGSGAPSSNDRFNGEGSPPSGVLPPKMDEAPAVPTPPALTKDASGPAPASEGVATTPVSYASEGPTPTSTSQPRGLRNNNPGNIEDGPFARSQPGYKGSDGRFATFETSEAGANASGNLLGAYGAKGINTLSGIINRWAPAADNNNTQAYISAVSKMTGLDPNQHLDMNDPALRTKIASAIHQYENGTGGTSGNVLSARNYNRASGLAPTDTAQGDTTELSAQSKQPPAAGVAPNIDWGANSKLWPALMSAGFGMLASRSPFPGVAIGEGAEQGMQTYGALRQQEQAQHMGQAKLDLEARKLSQEADFQQKKIGVEMMPYSGHLTGAQNIQTGFNQDKLNEDIRQHKAAETYQHEQLQAKMMEPKPFYNPDSGQMDYTVRTPEGDVVSLGTGKVIVGPHRGQAVPNSSAPGAAPGSAPSGQSGQPGQQQPGFQEAAFHPDGVWSVNSQQSLGPTDYSNGSKLPYIEHGMTVSDPAPVAGYSPDTIKTAAEWYLKTGKQPQISRGASPVAQMQNSYARAVMNYGNSLASSRGVSREELTDIWQTAPRVGQFILGQPGQQIVSLGTTMRHLETLKDYEAAWQQAKSGDTRPLNAIQAFIKTQWGSDAATNLSTVAHILGPEIIKAIGVAGAGTDKDRADASAQFTSAGSDQQVNGAIKATEQLLRGQLIGKENQARAAGLSEGRLQKLIGEKEYQELKNLDQNSSGVKTTVPGAAPAAPADTTLPPGIPQGSVSGRRKSDGALVWRTPDGQYIPKTQ